MHMRRRALPKAMGAFLIAATFSGSLPSRATADPVRTTGPEAMEAKGPNKKSSKRKRAAVAHGYSYWTRKRPGIAFASLPSGAERTPGEIAVATARAQLGKPYRWGAVGPSSFDCSGLTQFAWAAAGVGLPHSSRAQYGSLHRVSRADLRPGDLVYSPGHIGLYIGDGKMIHSPHSGRNVEIAPLHGNFVGGARPN